MKKGSWRHFFKDTQIGGKHKKRCPQSLIISNAQFFVRNDLTVIIATKKGRKITDYLNTVDRGRGSALWKWYRSSSGNQIELT